MDMNTMVIPKPAYNILRSLTGEARPDFAFSLAIKDLIRLRLEKTRHLISAFEEKYAITFEEFVSRWHTGQIADEHSFTIEQDYWEWEAAMTDLAALEALDSQILLIFNISNAV